MVTAIDARCSEPAPMPMATGVNPAIIDKRSHENWAQANTVGFKNGFAHRHPCRQQAVRIVHLQDSILLHDSQ